MEEAFPVEWAPPDMNSGSAQIGASDVKVLVLGKPQQRKSCDSMQLHLPAMGGA